MISVIIPAYNASEYIERAVSSVFNNCKKKEMEVIIVENGSVDNTVNIIKKMCEEYTNLRFYQSKKGVSAARNKGVRMANGQWIVFMDADDYWVNDISAIFDELDENDADLIMFGYEAGKRKCNFSNEIIQYKSADFDKYMYNMISNPTKYMQVWNKAFKKQLIDDNEIRFDENLKLSEDSDFTMQYLLRINSIYINPTLIYHYSVDNTSTIRNQNRDKIMEYSKAMEYSKEKISNKSKKIDEVFNEYVLMHFNIAMVRDVFVEKCSYKEKINRMKQATKIKIFESAIEHINLDGKMSLRMVPLICIKKKLYFVAFLIYYLRTFQNKHREKKSV